ncbi:MAG: hypothetical protein M1826_000302 [Phylliscum demangeonii]|nr:MAG: hypothetical protein M1826_000302 [Phylliscum demangeonii]
MLTKPCPRPSKGILRFLQHIALVGSVGGTVLLTDYRRRCISTLEEARKRRRQLTSHAKYSTFRLEDIELLATESRLPEAEAQLVAVMEGEQRPPTALVQTCAARLIRWTWTHTKNLEEVKSLVGRLERVFDKIPPSVAAVNEAIRACVEVGDGAGARWYVDWMERRYGLAPDANTMSRMLVLPARLHDWPAVHEGLRAIKRFQLGDGRGKTPDFLTDFGHIFHLILVEHMRTHSLEESIAFVQMAQAEYFLWLNKYIFNNVLTHCVVSEDTRALREWSRITRPLGFRFHQDTVRSLLKQLWFQSGKDPDRVRNVMERGERINAECFGSKAQALAWDLVLSSPRQPALKPATDSPLWREPDAADLGPGPMLAAIMRRDVRWSHRPGWAVTRVQQAWDRGYKLPDAVISMAVHASLEQTQGDQEAGAALLQRASAPGTPSIQAARSLLLNQALQPVNLSFGQVIAVCTRYYRSLQDAHLPVVHHLTARLAQNLINQHRRREGLRLLDDIYRSVWGQRYPFDIDTMTVFINAFRSSMFTRGVTWVASVVLAQDLRIDRTFLVKLTEHYRYFLWLEQQREQRRQWWRWQEQLQQQQTSDCNGARSAPSRVGGWSMDARQPGASSAQHQQHGRAHDAEHDAEHDVRSDAGPDAGSDAGHVAGAETERHSTAYPTHAGTVGEDLRLLRLELDRVRERWALQEERTDRLQANIEELARLQAAANRFARHDSLEKEENDDDDDDDEKEKADDDDDWQDENEDDDEDDEDDDDDDAEPGLARWRPRVL